MIEKPFFSRGFSPASTSMPVGVLGGVPRYADGQTLGPVLIGPVRTDTNRIAAEVEIAVTPDPPLAQSVQIAAQE